jgi:hypothetical protein
VQLAEASETAAQRDVGDARFAVQLQLRSRTAKTPAQV